MPLGQALNPRARLRFFSDLAKPLALAASYGAWILLFRLLFLSLLVYLLTRQGHHASFEEINEAFTANEIPFIGVASASFVLILRGFAPLFDRPEDFALSTKQLRASYLPGFLRGFAVGGSVVAALLLVGSLRFVGFFVQIEDAPLATAGIAVRIGAILAIGYADELVFRFKEDSAAVPARILIIALAYCVVKMAQFELSWMHFATLLLLSVRLSIWRLSQDSFLSGAGFCSAMLIVFYPLLSLPIFGSDFSGIFMLKHQSMTSLPSWVSGGAGGPLSSVAFQAVLLIECLHGWRRWVTQKKGLLKLSTSQ